MKNIKTALIVIGVGVCCFLLGRYSHHVTEGRKVYITGNSGKYHYAAECSGMVRPIAISEKDALYTFYEPCSKCVADK